jgi:hypothetical protein
MRIRIEVLPAQLLYASPAIGRLGIPANNWENERLYGVAQEGVAARESIVLLENANHLLPLSKKFKVHRGGGAECQ